MKSVLKKVIVGVGVLVALVAAFFAPQFVGDDRGTELATQTQPEPEQQAPQPDPTEIVLPTATVPVPTATPVPLPTPTPTSIPVATAVVVVAPTAEPTPLPTATAIPDPEPTAQTAVLAAEPAPTMAATVPPTPEPTATIEPTATVEPTVEPTPVPTLEPTVEATAEPTPEPTATPEPTSTPEPTVEVAAQRTTSLGLEATWMYVTSTDGLFLRDVAAGQIVDVLTYRSQVHITGNVLASGDRLWVELDVPQQGWVALSFLSVDQPAPPVDPGIGTGQPSEPPTADDWAAMRNCESGGRYTVVDPSGLYHGAYQFLPSTWDGLARRFWPELVGVLPSQASPADQDKMAFKLFELDGARPWPTCGRYLL